MDVKLARGTEVAPPLAELSADIANETVAVITADTFRCRRQYLDGEGEEKEEKNSTT